jgi:ABC-type transporter Mla subunit MlaD
MKNNETLWQLLKRLDEQAGQFNPHLAVANRYFDNTAVATRNLLDRHERDLDRLISKVKMALKPLLNQNRSNRKN